MADEAEGDSSGVVRLEADTSPFEAALDKAAAKFRGWGDRVTGLVDRMSETTSAKLGAWSEKVSSLASLPSESIGAAAGGGIGAAIGIWFGGPAGALLGNKIGNILGNVVGSAFDLTSLTKGADQFLSTVTELTAQAKVEFDDIRADGSETFQRIKDAWSKVSYKDVFNAIFDDSKEAQVKILEAWNETVGNIEDFFARMVDRVGTAFDTLWAKIREPLSRVAEFLQATAENLGLVEKGTQNWGQAILDVQDVGNKVLGGLAYGFGSLQDIFEKVGGYIYKYVDEPFLQFAADFAKTMANLARSIKEIPGIDRIIDPAQLDEGIDRFQGMADAFKDRVKEGLEAAQEAIDRRIGTTGEKYRDRIVSIRERGAELNRQREEAKPKPGAEPVPEEVTDQIAAKFAAPIKEMSALLQSSAAANNTIIKAQMERDGSAMMGLAQIQAKAAEEANRIAREQTAAQREANRHLKEIKDKMKDAPVVGKI